MSIDCLIVNLILHKTTKKQKHIDKCDIKYHLGY